MASAFTLQVARRIKAPAARLFAAWTTPGEIQRWLGPGGCTVLSAEIDLRVGGEYRFRFLMDGVESGVRGVYREISAPTRLVFTWRHDVGPQKDFGETLVTVDFAASAGGTEVRVRQERFLIRQARDDHRFGWRGALDNLAGLPGPGRARGALDRGGMARELKTADRRFEEVSARLRRRARVTAGTGRRGFGSGALCVRGKIFAMLTPKGFFVLKLPKQRVAALVEAGRGRPFEPRPGRTMREWLVADAGPDCDWLALAEEALRFVGQG